MPKICFIGIFLVLFLGCGRENFKRDLTDEPGNPLVSNGKWSALHEAIFQKRMPEIHDLLKKGVNVQVISADPKEHNITPLHLAVQQQLPEVVTLLLEKGAQVNAEMSTGTTPLHLAVGSAQVDLVRLLLDKGANPQLESFYVHSPLKMAQDAGNKEILELLKNRIESNTKP